MVGCFSGWAGGRALSVPFSLSLARATPSVEAPHPLGQAVDAPAPLAEVRGRSALEGEAFVSRVVLSSFAQVLPSGKVMPSSPFHVPVTSFGPSLADVAASAHSLTGSPALHALSPM